MGGWATPHHVCIYIYMIYEIFVYIYIYVYMTLRVGLGLASSLRLYKLFLYIAEKRKVCRFSIVYFKIFLYSKV